ncbi:conserved Plasmodium protein, unknown function [Plasmodium knowlesi strain H]|uniref:Uncharacterized protein n=3 Tax=Plasmodium knowlesi TaxID=5850 RepID=A0A5K1VQM1_PLAKH|nr:uncharacterized protein PKNH_1415000 [Plasmodium knowlesi strain H]OTN64173.1 Uncharacterized protein PKNOH_S140232800 [Plasmodium knowlesi]CAA9990750.1 conserved protein, unknown function [Plasmodium knowlesi strain H]SBO21157.1 conserved Plasmodium protein, unknown function [Plasmodium knowlesi strain H]SBO21618.1 conserved Plasmodium protein, unknown function [Plasmodium knowlesi strain H]VVS80224.1 conserved protein, unknown function [Plasmodium knowlesi strain H]|eukprot:XP_002262039.1 [Plasmodium knowlesi strain H]
MVPVLARKVFAKNKLNGNVTIKIKYMCRRNFSGVKFLDGNRKADESIYFKKEDEALLRNLLKNNPDLNPDFNFTDAEGGINNLSNDLCMVFSKHGIKGLSNSDAIKDIIKVFELNGYRKALDQ